MNGRCAIDPFDQAVDVCDMCFGEFCVDCLVETKRRKHPICKGCAVIAAGVRAKPKPVMRGSKKTAKERRKALRSAPIEERFQFFDVERELDEPAPTEPVLDEPAPAEPELDERGPVDAELAAAGTRTAKLGNEVGAAELDGSSQPSDDDQRVPAGGVPAVTSAIDQLDFIREQSRDESPDAEEGSTTARPSANMSLADRLAAIGYPSVGDRTGAGPVSAVEESVTFRKPRPFVQLDPAIDVVAYRPDEAPPDVQPSPRPAAVSAPTAPEPTAREPSGPVSTDAGLPRRRGTTKRSSGYDQPARTRPNPR